MHAIDRVKIEIHFLFKHTIHFPIIKGKRQTQCHDRRQNYNSWCPN